MEGHHFMSSIKNMVPEAKPVENHWSREKKILIFMKRKLKSTHELLIYNECYDNITWRMHYKSKTQVTTKDREVWDASI